MMLFWLHLHYIRNLPAILPEILRQVKGWERHKEREKLEGSFLRNCHPSFTLASGKMAGRWSDKRRPKRVNFPVLPLFSTDPTGVKEAGATVVSKTTVAPFFP